MDARPMGGGAGRCLEKMSTQGRCGNGGQGTGTEVAAAIQNKIFLMTVSLVWEALYFGVSLAPSTGLHDLGADGGGARAEP